MDEEKVLEQTTARKLEPINKAGLKDGAADGQAAAFQSSFDKGYLEGFNLGFRLGLHDAQSKEQLPRTRKEIDLKDKLKVNCQLCLGATSTEQSILELSHVQKIENIKILCSLKD